MFTTSVLSVEGPEVVSATGAVEVWAVVLEETVRGVGEAEEDEKWIVRRAGADWSFERETDMGIVGLWYLRRRR